MKLTLEQYRLNHQRMARVMHYLEAHLDADLRLETLAEVAHLSRFHFDHFYTAKVRESPIATVRRLRLKRAYRMLEEYPAMPIHELAGYSGYGSVAAFSRAFTRSFGHAPTDIRDARSSSTTILAAHASRMAPTFSVLSLPAIPMAYRPFSGPAVEAEKAYDEFGWRIASSGARWEYWAVYPDRWVDPVAHPDTWVSMWHCTPSHELPARLAGVAHAQLPSGQYARFSSARDDGAAVARYTTRLAADRAWQRDGGAVIFHYRNAWDYTAGSERLVDIYLPVRPRGR